MTPNTNPPTSPDIVPAIGVLDPTQCEEILHRNVVGPLGFTLHDRINITPVHFAYADGWIKESIDVAVILNALRASWS